MQTCCCLPNNLYPQDIFLDGLHVPTACIKQCGACSLVCNVVCIMQCVVQVLVFRSQSILLILKRKTHSLSLTHSISLAHRRSVIIQTSLHIPPSFLLPLSSSVWIAANIPLQLDTLTLLEKENLLIEL